MMNWWKDRRRRSLLGGALALGFVALLLVWMLYTRHLSSSDGRGGDSSVPTREQTVAAGEKIATPMSKPPADSERGGDKSSVEVIPPQPLVEAVLQGEAFAPDSLLGYFSNTGVPLQHRTEDINRLARAGNATSKGALMAVGDARLYLNSTAVEALGAYRDEETRRYLAGKLQDPDARMVRAAVRALASSAGVDAIPFLVAAIEDNWRRADGHELLVRTAAVEELGAIASPQGLAVLIKELERSNESGWEMEYGSSVIVALKLIGEPAGNDAILAYAKHLSERLPDDPLARAYIEEKIQEALAAVH